MERRPDGDRAGGVELSQAEDDAVGELGAHLGRLVQVLHARGAHPAAAMRDRDLRAVMPPRVVDSRVWRSSTPTQAGRSVRRTIGGRGSRRS